MEPTTIFKPTGFAVNFRTRAMKSSNGRRAVELAKSFRRMAIDAHRNAADGRDLGRNLLLWQQPALSGFRALPELDFDHLHLRQSEDRARLRRDVHPMNG